MSQNITIRASAWGSFFDCAHRAEWTLLMGHTRPAGMRALLGTAIHASTAIYDKARLDGAPVSIDDAAGALVDTLEHPEFEVDRTQDDLTLRDASRIGLTLHSLYCGQIAPQFQYVAVEMALTPLVIDCGGDVSVTLTGTMDRARVAATAKGVVIPDVKSGSRVIEHGNASTKGRAAQLGTYELLYEHTTKAPTAGGQIIALSTGSKPAAAVSPVFDARSVMAGTDTEPGLIEYAAQMFRSGMFPPNPQSVMCSKRYCARWNHCRFHP